jgi:hypothetical protein
VESWQSACFSRERALDNVRSRVARGTHANSPADLTAILQTRCIHDRSDATKPTEPGLGPRSTGCTGSVPAAVSMLTCRTVRPNVARRGHAVDVHEASSGVRPPQAALSATAPKIFAQKMSGANHARSELRGATPSSGTPRGRVSALAGSLRKKPVHAFALLVASRNRPNRLHWVAGSTQNADSARSWASGSALNQVAPPRQATGSSPACVRWPSLLRVAKIGPSPDRNAQPAGRRAT